MLLRIPDLLSEHEIVRCRAMLSAVEWVETRIAAGGRAAAVRHDLHVTETSPQGRQLGEIVFRALGRSPVFTSAALPLRICPPVFHLHESGRTFDTHAGNAIRFMPGSDIRVRTDIAATLFLSAPSDYDGGELVLEDSYGAHEMKLQAGDLLLYPASSLRRVAPITRGGSWAAEFWVQSMVKDDGKRRELYELNRGLAEARGALGDSHHACVALTAAYHNLLRRWSETG